MSGNCFLGFGGAQSERAVIAAIMQPYFFPYIGYFQLMNAADVFVLYDDAQYMKGGWVNRNRILVSGRPHWITLSVQKGALRLSIKERWYRDPQKDGEYICRVLQQQYSTAPCYQETIDLVAKCLAFDDSNVARFNANLLQMLAKTLELRCTILLSSELDRSDASKSGQQRVLEICSCVGADIYVNPISGAFLYQAPVFRAEGIDLRFLQATLSNYRQQNDLFCPSLSIIDVLMYNPPEKVAQMLGESSILDAHIADSEGRA